MRYGPHSSGGRILEGDTPFGRFRVVFAADNTIAEHEHEARDPAMWKGRANAPSVSPVKPHRAIMPPGDWLAALVKVVTFGLIQPCTGCQSRMAAMNRAGWRGLPRLWWRWLVRHF